MIRTLLSDWLKMRHSWITLLAVLGPTGVLSVNAVYYLLRYRDIVKPGIDNWGNLLLSIHPLLVATLILGITLLVSLISGLEHQGNTWKMLFAFPISRFKLYLSKFILVLFLLTVSSILATLGTTLLGLLLGFGFKIPWGMIIGANFEPLIAAITIVAVQLWLSTTISNQVIPLTAGVVGEVLVLEYKVIPHWLPWVYPFWAWPLNINNSQQYSILGFSLGIVLLLIGGICFARREIKQ